jgi:hypothetical protein
MDHQVNGKFSCELLCQSDSDHLQQIYTGFWVLQKRGLIKLKQRLCNKYLISDGAYLEVVVNGTRRIYYDTHDSFEIDTEALSRVDFYFKRSYSDQIINNLSYKEKIFPLGLNFVVYAAGLDILLLNRMSLQRRNILKLRNLLLGIGLDRLLGGRIYVDRFDRVALYPDLLLPPKILFMTRAFDPVMARSKTKREEREFLNDTRAKCIRLMRRELGNRFVGGFVHEDYAVAQFKDCLVENAMSDKQNYMKIMRQFPICVATTGLHGSIGWKMAEYVSHGKAIVTEKLNCRLPGRFERDTNYLDFIVPEDCVRAASKLCDEDDLRFEMMLKNYRYYESYVKPDSLILNTLAIATS